MSLDRIYYLNFVSDPSSDSGGVDGNSNLDEYKA